MTDALARRINECNEMLGDLVRDLEKMPDTVDTGVVLGALLSCSSTLSMLVALGVGVPEPESTNQLLLIVLNKNDPPKDGDDS